MTLGAPPRPRSGSKFAAMPRVTDSVSAWKIASTQSARGTLRDNVFVAPHHLQVDETNRSSHVSAPTGNARWFTPLPRSFRANRTDCSWVRGAIGMVAHPDSSAAGCPNLWILGIPRIIWNPQRTCERLRALSGSLDRGQLYRPWSPTAKVHLRRGSWKHSMNQRVPAGPTKRTSSHPMERETIRFSDLLKRAVLLSERPSYSAVLAAPRINLNQRFAAFLKENTAANMVKSKIAGFNAENIDHLFLFASTILPISWRFEVMKYKRKNLFNHFKLAVELTAVQLVVWGAFAAGRIRREPSLEEYKFTSTKFEDLENAIDHMNSQVVEVVGESAFQRLRSVCQSLGTAVQHPRPGPGPGPGRCSSARDSRE